MLPSCNLPDPPKFDPNYDYDRFISLIKKDCENNPEFMKKHPNYDFEKMKRTYRELKIQIPFSDEV